MSTVVTSPALMTAEAFFALGSEPRGELVRGRIVEIPPSGFWHGAICSLLNRRIGRYLDDHDIGHLVSNDAGVVTERGPDTVRGPDVAFFHYDRLPKAEKPVGYPACAPDLVFEVLSPTDRMRNVFEKIAEYLRSDVRVVCLVDPARRHIEVYRDEQPLLHFEVSDELTIPDVLPGFVLPLRDLFS